MIIKVTRPQLKKLLQIHGRLPIAVGIYRNGVFMGGVYRATVSTMAEAEQAMEYAKKPWLGENLKLRGMPRTGLSFIRYKYIKERRIPQYLTNSIYLTTRPSSRAKNLSIIVLDFYTTMATPIYD